MAKKTTKTPKQVNVAVVGLGFMGMTHLRAWKQIERARIVAVCDAVRLPVDGVLAGITGNLAGNDTIDLGREVKAFKTLEEVLADPGVDLVDLCVPTPLHPPQAIAALKAGKHVICEKPLARTAKLAREIIAAAKASKGYFMPAMCMRFWPEWAWLKPVIAKKTYGKVLAARFRRVSEPPGWSRNSYFDGAQSGGALLDLHIHDTDFVQFLFGRPTSVFSTGLSRFSGAIDHIVTQYQVAGGATVHAEGSWIMSKGHGFNMAYTVVFEKATADFDLTRGENALKLCEEGKEPRFIKCEGPDGYGGELRHLTDAILSGKPSSVVTGQDGLSAVEICEAEEKSIKTGKVVTLKP
ncbi:MAG: Gfo/Idh/MocA family oxidoreductase [Verrucomicrobiota bacterium]